MKRLLLLVISSLLPAFTEAVWCRQCFNYNGQVCVNAADCQGNYCLFEEITQYSGVKSTKKTCISQPYYQYPDGALLSSINSCATRMTSSGQYMVKICDSANYCNDYCNVAPLIPTLPPPPPPPVTAVTFAPVLPGMVECFACETFDGTDCRDNTCQGKYCLYLRQLTAGTMRIKKSCLNEAVATLDDDTVVQSVDVCEIRNTQSSQYFIKMCNDQDYCNGYCNPEPIPDIQPPQRQPLVTCYECESRSGECFTGTCTSNYCLYEHQYSRSTGQSMSRKGCSSLAYVEWPDNTISREVNQCEYKTINDIDYQVKICNNGNNCNSACAPTPGRRTVTCTMCESTVGSDCTSPSTCSGLYCFYEHQVNQANGGSFVKKSCKNDAELIYPDGSIYRNVGFCEYKSINGINYSLKACNSSNYCSTPCLNPVTTTALPINSVGAHFLWLQGIVTIISLYLM